MYFKLYGKHCQEKRKDNATHASSSRLHFGKDSQVKSQSNINEVSLRLLLPQVKSANLSPFILRADGLAVRRKLPFVYAAPEQDTGPAPLQEASATIAASALAGRPSDRALPWSETAGAVPQEQQQQQQQPEEAASQQDQQAGVPPQAYQQFEKGAAQHIGSSAQGVAETGQPEQMQGGELKDQQGMRIDEQQQGRGPMQVD
eukprot:scaffold30983_cov19-Tisochrysis_lutea.AAC.1